MENAEALSAYAFDFAAVEIWSFQRSIRFTKNEWDAVIEATEKVGVAPGSFVRKAAARAAADYPYLCGGGLTPELAELIQRTHRGVHLLTYLKREELAGSDRGALFDRAAEDARIAQITALGSPETSSNSRIC